jgi:hypothetical protein
MANSFGTQTWHPSSRQLRRTLHAHGLRRSLQYAIESEEREAARIAAREANPLTRLTAAEYFALRKQVRVDVEAYLFEHGQDGVTQEMVTRWCGEATKACLKDMVRGIVENDPTSPEMLERIRARIQQKMGDGPTLRAQQAQANGTQGIARHVPAAPSPHYIAKHGVAELDRLDIFVELNKLFHDANLMRSAAIRQDPATGQEKVVNPRTFDKSISRRLEILATSINTQKELWDLQRMEAFYGTIIETIAGCDPAVAQEIQRRLSVLNIHVGMT